MQYKYCSVSKTKRYGTKSYDASEGSLKSAIVSLA